MNLQSRSRWMLKILLVFVTVTLLAGQPLLPAFAMPLEPVDHGAVPNAPEANLIVNTTADNTTAADNLCTLREAINNANNDLDTTSGDCSAGSGPDTITFSVNGTIFLTSSLPTIDDDLTIDGGNTITIDGGGLYRVMDVNVGMIINLLNLTITNGAAPDDGGGIRNAGILTVTNSILNRNAATDNGGALYNAVGGTVTVISSTFSGNSVTATLGLGGGFYNLGTLTVRNSTFSNNSATNGGSGYNDGALAVTDSTFATGDGDSGSGLYNSVGRTATVNNSTFDRNYARLYGSGFYNSGTLTVTNSTFSGNATGSLGLGGGLYSDGTSVVMSSTFISNSAPSGGGLYNNGGAASLQHTIVAGSAGGDCIVGAGTLTADSVNLDTDGTCDNATPSTVAQINLGPLADNGGSTQTVALLPGSVAIDAGALVCVATDQRGVIRPQGPRCDVGAFELNQYTLTINTAGNGSGVVTPTVGTHLYITGTLVPITATANTGSVFTGWSGDLTGSTNPTDITMNGDKVVTATFTLITYTITPTAGANGSINPGTPQPVNYGDSITFTIAADTGHHILDVGVDGVSQGAISSYTFDNVIADHTITASFDINTYVITPTAGLNGSINPGTATTVNYGDSITFTITADTGYHILDVGVDGVSQGAIGSYTFSNVIADHTITASFAIDTFVITPTAGLNGSINPGTATTVNYGESITFTITADTGYHILDVGVDSVSQGAIGSYTFDNVIADHTLTATFEVNPPNTFTLTVIKAGTGDGTVTLDPPGPTYTAGSVVTLTATPLISSTFTGWSGAVSGTTSPITLTMDADKTVTATFTLKTYVITPTAGLNGTITPSTPQTVNYGGSSTFTITANTGYHILDVGVDGVSQGALSSYTFNNVTASHTITAAFAINTYTLTPSAGANGVITPSTSQTVNYGSSLTFTIAANTGYHIADVGVDGISQGVISSYTFNNVTANHTITATFALNPPNTFTLTVIKAGTGNGTVTLNPVGPTYTAGTVVTLTATPFITSTFTGWSGALSGTTSPITLTMNANKTVTATFTLKYFVYLPLIAK